MSAGRSRKYYLQGIMGGYVESIFRKFQIKLRRCSLIFENIKCPSIQHDFLKKYLKQEI